MRLAKEEHAERERERGGKQSKIAKERASEREREREREKGGEKENKSDKKHSFLYIIKEKLKEEKRKRISSATRDPREQNRSTGKEKVTEETCGESTCT